MTKMFKAEGIGSTGIDSFGDGAFVISSTITDGFKSVIGRRISISMDKHALRFLLTSLATYRKAILALANAICESDAMYGPPPPKRLGQGYSYDQQHQQRMMAYNKAVTQALEAEQ